MAVHEISLRTLRAARIVFIGIVFLYVRAGERYGPAPKGVSPVLRLVIYVLAASIIPTVLLLRSKELKRTKDRLTLQAGRVAAFRRWRGIQFAILGCLLAIPLYGLVLRFQGGTFTQALPFYIVGFLLLTFLPIHDADRA
jgi:uncharacterized membrane protein